MSLTAYAAGVTTTGLEILSKALNEVMGSVSIVELDKNNLRYSVRMSMKSASIVLVVLDSGSESACADIENGLYASEKYYSYTDDKDLACFLNEKYGLSLEIPEDEEVLGSVQNVAEASSVDIDVMRESYEARIADRDGIIDNLNCRIKELSAIIDERGYSAKSDGGQEDLRSENVALRSTLSDLTRQLESSKSSLADIESKYAELLSDYERAKERVTELQGAYSSLQREYAESVVSGSEKSGVLRDKDAFIARLEGELSDVRSEKISFEAECESLKEKIADFGRELSELKIDLDSRNSEITRLKGELQATGNSQQQVEDYRRQVSNLEADCVDLRKAVASLEGDARTAESTISNLTLEVESLKASLVEKQGYVDRSEANNAELNRRIIELNGRIRVLEQSTDRNADMESTLAELSAVRLKLAELNANVFNVLYSKALPKSSSRVMLFNTAGMWYENIRFVFSGSTESRKGTYRCLLNEIRQDTSSDKYLLVDAVSETFVDYVFEILKMSNGLKWFTEGGGVQQYITQTCAGNARVLSPGLGYINDSFYLAIDWEKRLKELEMSGYKVILYCGDLSNLVGRVLFENFADVGKTDIYVHGNSVGSRTMTSVSQGISNIGNATVKYFDYDEQVSRFFEAVKKKCTCEIIAGR